MVTDKRVRHAQFDDHSSGDSATTKLSAVDGANRERRTTDESPTHQVQWPEANPRGRPRSDNTPGSPAAPCATPPADGPFADIAAPLAATSAGSGAQTPASRTPAAPLRAPRALKQPQQQVLALLTCQPMRLQWPANDRGRWSTCADRGP